MSYIIVWKHNTRDAFIQTDSHGFVEEFEDEQDAQDSIDEIIKLSRPDDPHFFRPKIYKEA